MRRPAAPLLRLLSCALLAALPMACPGSARAASAPRDAPRELSVSLPEKEGGGAYLLLSDPAAADAWRYLPLSARVARQDGAEGDAPDLELVKFQRVDPKIPERLEQGARLSLALELAPDPATLAALEARVARETGAAKVSLSLLPVRSALLRIETGPGGEAITAAPLQGIGPLAAYSALRFSLPLDRAGAKLAEALVSAPAGLVFRLDLTAEVPLAPGASASAAAAPRPFELPGSIALAPLPPAVRDRLVRDESRAFFERARLVLPAIAEDPDLGIDRIQLDVVPVAPDMRHLAPPQVFVWTPAGRRFRDATGEAVLDAVFELGPIKAAAGAAKLSNLRFKVTRSIAFSWPDPRDRKKTGTLKEFDLQPLFDGEAPVSTPLSAADVLAVDPGSLTFAAVARPGGASGPPGPVLESARLVVKAGNYTVERRIAPRATKQDARLRPPGVLYVLAPRQRRKPIEVSIEFALEGGTAVKWENADGRDPDGTLYLPLFDEDWQGAAGE